VSSSLTAAAGNSPQPLTSGCCRRTDLEEVLTVVVAPCPLNDTPTADMFILSLMHRKASHPVHASEIEMQLFSKYLTVHMSRPANPAASQLLMYSL